MVTVKTRAIDHDNLDLEAACPPCARQVHELTHRPQLEDSLKSETLSAN